MIFWSGFGLLALPIFLYIFTFLNYIYMLFDSRLDDLVKVLKTDNNLNKSFFTLYKQKLGSIEEYYKYKHSIWSKIEQKQQQKLGISPRIINAPPKSLSSSQVRRITKVAKKIKTDAVTELVEKISLRLDGVSLPAYCFSLILLQTIVGLSFAIPAAEVIRLGTIGTDEFIHVGVEKLATYGYLSTWAIESGFLGAFIYSFIDLMERIPRKDVTPRYYLNISLRYVFAAALSSLFFLIFHQAGVVSVKSDAFSLGIVAAISFIVGMFPNKYFRTVTSIVDKRLGNPGTRDIPLANFTGISPTEASRLWEEGVDNVDQLADCSVQELYRRTRFDQNRLKNLVSRAMLWKYVFGLDTMRHIVIDLESHKINGQKDEKPAPNDMLKKKGGRVVSICGYRGFMCFYIQKTIRITYTKSYR
jgi:hypothetical protein